MKEVRVLSVSPTFHKLVLETNSWIPYIPQEAPSPQFPRHSQRLTSHNASHLMACNWLREGRHLEKIPRIRSSTFQPEERKNKGTSDLEDT